MCCLSVSRIISALNKRTELEQNAFSAGYSFGMLLGKNGMSMEEMRVHCRTRVPHGLLIEPYLSGFLTGWLRVAGGKAPAERIVAMPLTSVQEPRWLKCSELVAYEVRFTIDRIQKKGDKWFLTISLLSETDKVILSGVSSGDGPLMFSLSSGGRDADMEAASKLLPLGPVVMTEKDLGQGHSFFDLNIVPQPD